MNIGELKDFLVSQGFSISTNQPQSIYDMADWYAWRHSKLDARRCECNDDKPSMQLVVKPYDINLGDNRSSGVEVELCGEYDDNWWQLLAYGLSFEELRDGLDKTESRLIAAWNALEVK